MAAFPQHDRAYGALREALLEGRIAPGQSVTVASVAQMLGQSTMPVREAVRRVVAEGGLEASETRRLRVPELRRDRFAALIRARLLLEPEAAVDAMHHLNLPAIEVLARTDTALSAAIRAQDVAGYMRFNYRFHFGIYRAVSGSVLCPLIERLWLQCGPYMHLLFDQAPAHMAADRHQQALAAIRAQDAVALRAAISADINDALATLQAARGTD